MAEMTIEQKRALAIASARLRLQESAPAEKLSKVDVTKSTSPMSWSDVGVSAIQNIPSSVGGLISGIYGAVSSPIDTLKNISQIGGGAAISALPESAQKWMLENANDPAKVAESINKAGTVGDFYKKRYGSEDGFKEAVATDPAGVAADFATILTAGGTAVSKIPGLANAGGLLKSAGVSIDPLSLTAKAVSKPVGMLGRRTADLVGSVGTHTGGEGIRQMFAAGKKGGDVAESAAANLRGQAPMEAILNQAKDALGQLRKQRSAQYLSSKEGVLSSNKPLDFSPIEKTTKDIVDIGTYKGKVLDRSAATTKQQIVDLIDEWKTATPEEYHTIEGIDALKQAIGDIKDSTQYGTPARAVADRAYNSVRLQITKSNPEYAKMMKDYETASNQIKEIEKSLSLGNKASADTAIRKLQSILRNSGNRAELAKVLEDAGATGLTSNLAGQALQSWTPVGLGKVASTGIAGAGALTGNVMAIPLLALQSPRLVGEASLLLGKGSRAAGKGTSMLNSLAKKYNVDPVILANYVYQSNQTKGEQ